jgi:hypothetical protein
MKRLKRFPPREATPLLDLVTGFAYPPSRSCHQDQSVQRPRTSVGQRGFAHRRDFRLGILADEAAHVRESAGPPGLRF